MQKLLYIFVLSFLTAAVSGQKALEIAFKKYQNNDNVSAISFDEKVMQYVKNDDKDFKTNIEKVEILVFAKGYDLSDSDKATIKGAIAEDNYEMLINAKSKGNSAEAYGLSDSEDNLTRLYARAVTDEAIVYLMLKGEIHFDELAEIGFNFDGAEMFEKFANTKNAIDEKNEENNEDKN